MFDWERKEYHATKARPGGGIHRREWSQLRQWALGPQPGTYPMSRILAVSWEDRSPSSFLILALAFPASVSSTSLLTCCPLSYCPPATRPEVQGKGPMCHTPVWHSHLYELQSGTSAAPYWSKGQGQVSRRASASFSMAWSHRWCQCYMPSAHPDVTCKHSTHRPTTSSIFTWVYFPVEEADSARTQSRFDLSRGLLCDERQRQKSVDQMASFLSSLGRSSEHVL